MSTNCLKTQIKATVQNDSLLKLGEVRVYVKSKTNGSRVLNLNGTSTTISTVDGSNKISLSSDLSNLTNSITFVGYAIIYLSDGEYELSIANKYVLTSISDNGAYYNFPYLNLEQLYCPKITGLAMGGTLTFGDIKFLSQNIKLTTLNLSNCVGVTGSVESLAAAQVEQGRVSGTIAVRLTGSQCTLNGQTVSDNLSIRFGDPSEGGSMVDPTEEELAQGYQIVTT